MSIVGALFFGSSVVGLSGLAISGASKIVKRNRPVGAQIQAALASAGLCNKTKTGKLIPWRIDNIRLTRSGAGEGLLEGHELIMRYPAGRSVYDVMRHADQIGEWLGCTVRAEHRGKRLHLFVYDVSTPVTVPFGQHLLTRIRGTWEIPIGLSESGWVFHDFGSTPHVLVGGATGSGKTNLLTMLTYALTQTHAPADLRLHVVDMKMGLSFRWLEGSPYLEGFTNGKGSHANRLQDALDVVEHVHDLMEIGLKKLDRWEVTSWQEAQEQGNRLPHHLLIVDEAAELQGRGDEETKKIAEGIWNRIASLTALGRAPGVHVIICTQRPQVDIVPGIVKANLDARIAFRLPDATSSKTILGIGGAENLPPIKGRAIYKTDETVIVQTPKIDYPSIRLRAMANRRSSQGAGRTRLSDEWEAI